MPNFDADHKWSTDRKCEYGSTIIEICKVNLWNERLMIAVISAFIGAMLMYFTK